MSIKRTLFNCALDASMLDFKLGLLVEDLEELDTEEARQLIKEVQFLKGQLHPMYRKLMDLQDD